MKSDIAEVRTEEGKLRLFVAIHCLAGHRKCPRKDRTSKFAYVELHEKAGKVIAAQFLRNFIKVLPYKIHTILTDNGIQFTNRKKDKTPDGISLIASVMKTALNIG